MVYNHVGSRTINSLWSSAPVSPQQIALSDREAHTHGQTDVRTGERSGPSRRDPSEREIRDPDPFPSAPASPFPGFVVLLLMSCVCVCERLDRKRGIGGPSERSVRLINGLRLYCEFSSEPDTQTSRDCIRIASSLVN